MNTIIANVRRSSFLESSCFVTLKNKRAEYLTSYFNAFDFLSNPKKYPRFNKYCITNYMITVCMHWLVLNWRHKGQALKTGCYDSSPKVLCILSLLEFLFRTISVVLMSGRVAWCFILFHVFIQVENELAPQPRCFIKLFYTFNPTYVFNFCMPFFWSLIAE